MKAEMWYRTTDGTVLTDRYEGEHVTAQIYPDRRGRVSGRGLSDSDGAVLSATYDRVIKVVLRP